MPLCTLHWLVTGDADLLNVTQPLPFTIATPAGALGHGDFQLI